MCASELQKTSFLILCNYKTCTEEMKLVVNSSTLSLIKITQTDGQSCGIFHNVEWKDVDMKNIL